MSVTSFDRAFWMLIILAAIDTDRLPNDPEAVRLAPDSIAKVSLPVSRFWIPWCMLNDVQSYLYLVNQDTAAWSWELDCKFIRCVHGLISSFTIFCSTSRSREVVKSKEGYVPMSGT